MLTHDYIRSRIDYNPETGDFTWLPRHDGSSWDTRYAGKRAGTPHSHGYLSIRIDGELYLAHRLAWFWMNGEWPDAQIDHINRNKSDNRIRNLRSCSATENMQNGGMYRTNTSGFCGVRFDRRRGTWAAQISVGGKRKNLGSAKSAEEAHAIYMAEKVKHLPNAAVAMRQADTNIKGPSNGL